MIPVHVIRCLLLLLVGISLAHAKSHPRLLLSPESVQSIRKELVPGSGFSKSLTATRTRTDEYLASFPDVPVPVDPGGGYTHEKHKRNGIAIHDAGILYQLTGKNEYATAARDLLLAYAELYPTLGQHPVKRSRVPGRLFWQTLNEAVWLVYAIQGYDAIYETLDLTQRARIESGVLRPLADFISDQSPETFDRIHNHGTWAVAAVGMTGYVLGDEQYVKRALYGLNVDGESGFIRQLDLLFSPDGYYTEGPYYQRYALMPFVLFARAIEANDPELEIFEYRDGILLKAIYACIDLSYAGLFFPLNDAIKDKGLDTVELRYAISIAFALNSDPMLLSIAQIQQPFVLTADGFRLSRAVDANLSEPYDYKSKVLRDGPSGDQGALVVLREGVEPDQQALVFKSTSQGMGHGHFDKLNWLFYDNGDEIVTDYGAARFLNVEQKNGGTYLPENTTWAKQTVAHNTLVVDETSHFGGDAELAQEHHPELLFFETNDTIHIASAVVRDAYSDVEFIRTIALINDVVADRPIVVDVLNVASDSPHQYDLPLHFNGQIISFTPEWSSHAKVLQPMGDENGYQHLWLRSESTVGAGQQFTVTWLKGNRFYTNTTIARGGFQVFAAELGASDPNYNLKRQQVLIVRSKGESNQSFVSVLEPHGEYNGPAEYTLQSSGQITSLRRFTEGASDLIRITNSDGERYFLSLSYFSGPDAKHKINADGQTFEWQGPYGLFARAAGSR